jgi:uncharacterized protein YycO
MVESIALALLSYAFGDSPDESTSSSGGSSSIDKSLFEDGDIIFQVTHSSQSQAVSLASGSPITHVGLINVSEGRVTVIEAMEPVREVSVEQFVGRSSHWGLSRLNEEMENPNWADSVISAARSMKGKHYDGLFQWSDDRIYCSELVWKAYKSSLGIELAELETVGDLDLSPQPVQELIRRRTANGATLNLEEPIITPGHLIASDKLTVIIPMADPG